MVASKFRMLFVKGGDVVVRWTLSEGINQVGRTSGSLICLPHDLLSRRHAELLVSVGEVFVRDIGSRNGTFIDGRRIDFEHFERVRPGQWIQFANVRLLLTTDTEQEFDFGSELETNDPRFAKAPVLELPSELQAKLTPRQQEVLLLALRGLARKQIAVKLDISVETVKSHLHAVYSICNVLSLGELHHFVHTRASQSLTIGNADIPSHPSTGSPHLFDDRQERRA